jgi:glyoxylase-like metal-dependent hydrolase (beta-lactamase superfamily II)
MTAFVREVKRAMIQAGPYQVTAVEAERFRLDGGAMFGVVPKPLWSRKHPADDANRIQMVTRCLLARGDGRVVLVDTGMGGDWSAKERTIYAIENGDRSIGNAVASAGLDASDVTDVVLTHLHFDHAGGGVIRTGDVLEPAFPNARYHVQEEHLTWALEPTERDRRSFRPETFLPLRDAGRLALARGDAEILPGIFVERTSGHTIGHQVVRIGEGEGSVVYCGDLIPTAAHLPAPWVMGYDLQPVTTMQEKMALLERAADRKWLLVLEHDPSCPAVRVDRDGDAFVATEILGIPGPDGSFE